MIEIGDKVTWDGKVGVVTNINIPKCKCKGKGTYTIDIDGVGYKVPVTANVVLYESGI
jgi:hypothetical protein